MLPLPPSRRRSCGGVLAVFALFAAPVSPAFAGGAPPVSLPLRFQALPTPPPESPSSSTAPPVIGPDPRFPFDPWNYEMIRAGWGDCGPCWIGSDGLPYLLPPELQTGGAKWHPSHPPQSAWHEYVNPHPEDGPPGLFGVP